MEYFEFSQFDCFLLCFMAFTIQKCISVQKKMKKVCFASCTFYLKILNFLHEGKKMERKVA